MSDILLIEVQCVSIGLDSQKQHLEAIDESMTEGNKDRDWQNFMKAIKQVRIEIDKITARLLTSIDVCFS